MSILIGSFSVSTVSAEGITLFNNNTLNTNSFFTIKDDGNAIVIAEYMGYEGITTNATVKITIEKRFLLVFWNDVATWTDEVTGYYYSNSYSTTVKKETYIKLLS